MTPTEGVETGSGKGAHVTPSRGNGTSSASHKPLETVLEEWVEHGYLDGDAVLTELRKVIREIEKKRKNVPKGEYDPVADGYDLAVHEIVALLKKETEEG